MQIKHWITTKQVMKKQLPNLAVDLMFLIFITSRKIDVLFIIPKVKTDDWEFLHEVGIFFNEPWSIS